MIESRMRNTLFFIFCGLILVTMSFTETQGILDDALVFYLIYLILALLCFLFWGIWWVMSRKKPTFIYTVIGLLFLSEVYSTSSDLYGRWLFLSNFTGFLDLLETNYWSYRRAPLVLVSSWLLAWIVSRFFGKKIEEEQEGKVRILIVDDNDQMVDMLVQEIRTVGDFEIDTATSYNKGLRLVRSNKYSCVILDLVLDSFSGDGVSLAKEIRDSDLDVYIVVITGYWDSGDRVQIVHYVDDFIRKPFELEYFRTKLILWLSVYARRVRLRNYVDSADDQIKQELRALLKGKFRALFDRKE